MAAHQLHAETDPQGNQEYENRDLQGVEKSRFDDAAVLTVAVFGFTQIMDLFFMVVPVYMSVFFPLSSLPAAEPP